MTRHVLLTALMAVSVTPALAAEGTAPATAAPAAKPAVAAPAPAATAPAAKPAPAAVAAKPAPADANKPLATVNGVAIPKIYGDILRAQAQRNSQQPVTDEVVRAEVVRIELLAQEAIKQGLDKEPTLQANFDVQKKYGLAKALIQDYARKHPATEEAISAEYERIKASAPARVEYMAHHILVKTEKQATDLIAKLADKKAKFEDLAKKHSTDKGSAEKGGELPWNLAEGYVKEFADALVKLKKGEMSKEPVKTKFGWHIIRQDDSRKEPFPELNAVKDRVATQVQQQAVDNYIAKLQAGAKIE